MRITQNKMAYYLLFSRQVWVKEPRHSENISDKKCHLYRCMRISVFSCMYLVNISDYFQYYGTSTLQKSLADSNNNISESEPARSSG